MKKQFFAKVAIMTTVLMCSTAAFAGGYNLKVEQGEVNQSASFSLHQRILTPTGKWHVYNDAIEIPHDGKTLDTVSLAGDKLVGVAMYITNSQNKVLCKQVIPYVLGKVNSTMTITLDEQDQYVCKLQTNKY